MDQYVREGAAEDWYVYPKQNSNIQSENHVTTHAGISIHASPLPPPPRHPSPPPPSCHLRSATRTNGPDYFAVVMITCDYHIREISYDSCRQYANKVVSQLRLRWVNDDYVRILFICILCIPFYMLVCQFLVVSKDAGEPRGTKRGVSDRTRINQTKMPYTGYSLAQQQRSFIYF